MTDNNSSSSNNQGSSSTSNTTNSQPFSAQAFQASTVAFKPQIQQPRMIIKDNNLTIREINQKNKK